MSYPERVEDYLEDIAGAIERAIRCTNMNLKDAVIEHYRAGQISHCQLGEALGLDYLQTETLPSGARALSIAPPPAPRRTRARHVTMPCRPDGIGDARIQTTTLYVREGDAFREAPARQVLLQAQELIDRQFRSGCWVLSKPELLRLFLKIHLGARDHEVFAVLFLDAHRRLIEYVELFRGTIDATQVHPREVVKEALARNAAGVILVHNHPSGVAEPSQADELITIRLRAALDLVGVKVVDHMVVGESSRPSWNWDCCSPDPSLSAAGVARSAAGSWGKDLSSPFGNLKACAPMRSRAPYRLC